MKDMMKKITAILLALLICVMTLTSCSGGGKKLMKLEGESLSVNMFQLFLSRMKGTLASSYAYGEDATEDSFWDTVMSSDGTTYNDYFTKKVLDDAKVYLASLYAYKEEGLKLPDQTLAEIDEQLKKLLEDDAGGSKNTFNQILLPYGVNYGMLREAYILEAKIAQLREHLFGNLDEALIEEYYENNYVRFKQVFIYTYDLLYVTDDNGDDIYYDSIDSTRIAYNKSANVKKDADGEPVKDKNGDTVYVNDDGSIAYDKQNGKRTPKLGEDGYQLTRDYTKEELKAASDRAQIIMEECETGNYTLFDRMVADYSEDGGMSEFPNGYYITSESEYVSSDFVSSVCEMKVGEIKRISSKHGIHLVMRYELDEGGYKNSENADFFISDSGSYVFKTDLENQLLEAYLSKCMDKIVVNEKLLEGVDIKSVGVNYYY